MIEREITIINRLGLHARAAAKLVALASQFNSRILISREQREVNAKSIMGVMMLAASRGMSVTLRIEGDDETEATAAIVDLVNGRFGEDE